VQYISLLNLLKLYVHNKPLEMPAVRMGQWVSSGDWKWRIGLFFSQISSLVHCAAAEMLVLALSREKKQQNVRTKTLHFCPRGAGDCFHKFKQQYSWFLFFFLPPSHNSNTWQLMPGWWSQYRKSQPV